MDLPDIPEYVASYFDFVIDFALNPAKACEPYRGSGKVNKTLVSFAVLGTVFAWLCIAAIKKLATNNNDNEGILKYANKIDTETLPLIILPSILLLSIIFHLAVKIVFLLNRREYNTIIKSDINFKNTFNGLLAFFSFAPFSLMVLLLITVYFMYRFHASTIHPGILFLIILPYVLLQLSFLIWYLPVSVGSMQPERISKSYKKAFFSIYAFIMVIVAAVSLLADL